MPPPCSKGLSRTSAASFTAEGKEWCWRARGDSLWNSSGIKGERQRGHRYGQVVQLGEGFRVHLTARRRTRRLRASHSHPDEWMAITRGRPEGRVRGAARPEGPAGCQRPRRLDAESTA